MRLYQRLVRQSPGHISALTGQKAYLSWMEARKITPALKGKMCETVRSFSSKPLISVVMPVYNADPRWLGPAVQSVKSQIYDHWELCVVDDASTREDTRLFLEGLHHPRIRIRFLEKNSGISAATNAAIAMAEGTHVVFLDHDDELWQDALFEVAGAINRYDPDLVYTDEDKIAPWGEHRFPFFKPDWSPDLLRCQNYICHLTVIRKTLLDTVGGLDPAMDGAQDHDLILRVTEKTKNIHHIPKILYSWREIEASTAINPESKPAAAMAGRMAVAAHMKRVFSPEAFLEESPYLFVQDVRFPLNSKPLVSIIIPTRDGLDYLKGCVESILALSDYPNYEILILDNGSVEEATLAWLEFVRKSDSRIRVVRAAYPFNWSGLNNHGIQTAKGEVFIFLNNDTRVISRDWIRRLAEQAVRRDVGVVGALLLYEDGTIQHAGVVVGMGGWADHIFKAMPAMHAMSPFVSPMVKRNVLAVTGSCMAISGDTIERIGRFDENFQICGSDVEICLRAHRNGLVNIYDPFVKLYHYESKTRKPHDIPACDFEMSRRHYEPYWKGGDPFYNPNLSLSSTTPTVKV